MLEAVDTDLIAVALSSYSEPVVVAAVEVVADSVVVVAFGNYCSTVVDMGCLETAALETERWLVVAVAAAVVAVPLVVAPVVGVVQQPRRTVT